MRHLSVGHAEPLRAELMSFVKAIKERTPPPVTGEDGVASLAVAIQCLEGRSASVQQARPAPRRAHSVLAKS
jgi:predicted dehydrogenase